MNTIGDRIKLVRKSKNLTQKDFASHVLVSASYISRVESNKEIPTDMLVKLIALEFNVNYDWLLKGSENINVTENDFDYFARDEGSTYKQYIGSLYVEINNSLNNLENADYLNVHAILDNLIQLFNINIKQSYKTLLIEKIASITIAFVEASIHFSNIDLKTKQGMSEFIRFMNQFSPDIRDFFINLISLDV